MGGGGGGGGENAGYKHFQLFTPPLHNVFYAIKNHFKGLSIQIICSL